ncbi:dentin sialophosphoprotein-like [Actinia tenebrosa]|uniref:Dentin sialophosphoprotein-like n=1 Tax=Actinia tenebrosa TaxID=6105 RepID=A0A6P8I4W6_ACTTE|nr:dentin sialophosphoprotein-like [Actinia tenebrosa]
MAKSCVFLTLLFGSLVPLYKVCLGTNDYDYKPVIFDQQTQWKPDNKETDARRYFERPTENAFVDGRYVLNTDLNSKKVTFSGPNEYKRKWDDSLKYRSLGNDQLVTNGFDDNTLSSGEDEDFGEDVSYDKDKFASGDGSSDDIRDNKNDDESIKHQFKEKVNVSGSQDVDDSNKESSGLFLGAKTTHEIAHDEDNTDTTNSDNYPRKNNLYKDYGTQVMDNNFTTKRDNYTEWTSTSDVLDKTGNNISNINTDNNSETISRINLDTLNHKMQLAPNVSIARGNYTQQATTSGKDKGFQGNEASNVKNEFPESVEGSSFNDLIRKYEVSAEKLDQESSGSGEAGYSEALKTTDKTGESYSLNNSENESGSFSRINLDILHEKLLLDSKNGSLAQQNDTRKEGSSGNDSYKTEDHPQDNQASSLKDDFPESMEGEGSSFDEKTNQDSSGMGVSGQEETLMANIDKNSDKDSESAYGETYNTEARILDLKPNTKTTLNISGNSGYPDNTLNISSQIYSKDFKTSELSSNFSYSNGNTGSSLKQEEGDIQRTATNLAGKKEYSKMSAEERKDMEASGVIGETSGDINSHHNEGASDLTVSGDEKEENGSDRVSDIDNNGNEEGSGLTASGDEKEETGSDRVSDIDNNGNEEASDLTASGDEKKENGSDRVSDIDNNGNEEGSGLTAGGDQVSGLSNHGNEGASVLTASGDENEASGGAQLSDIDNNAISGDQVSDIDNNGNKEASGMTYEAISGDQVSDIDNNGNEEASGMTEETSGSEQASNIDNHSNEETSGLTEEAISGDQASDIDNHGNEETSALTEEAISGDQANDIDNHGNEEASGLTEQVISGSPSSNNENNINEEASGLIEEAVIGDQESDTDNNGSEEPNGLTDKASDDEDQNSDISNDGNEETSGLTDEAISGDQVSDIDNNGNEEASGLTDESSADNQVIDSINHRKQEASKLIIEASGGDQVIAISNIGNEDRDMTDEVRGGENVSDTGNHGTEETSAIIDEASGSDQVNDVSNHGHEEGSGLTEEASGSDQVSDVNNHSNEQTSGLTDEASGGDQVSDVSNHGYEETSGLTEEASGSDQVSDVSNHGYEGSGLTEGASGSDQVSDVSNHGYDEGSGLTEEASGSHQVSDVSNHGYEEGSGLTEEASGDNLVFDINNRGDKKASEESKGNTNISNTNNFTDQWSSNNTKFVATNRKLPDSGANAVIYKIKDNDEEEDNEGEESGGIEVKDIEKEKTVGEGTPEDIPASVNYPHNGQDISKTNGNKEVEMEPVQELGSGHKTDFGKGHFSSGRADENGSKILGAKSENELEYNKVFNGSGIDSNTNISASTLYELSKNATDIVVSYKKETKNSKGSNNVSLSREGLGNGSFSSFKNNTAGINITTKTNESIMSVTDTSKTEWKSQSLAKFQNSYGFLQRNKQRSNGTHKNNESLKDNKWKHKKDDKAKSVYEFWAVRRKQNESEPSEGKAQNESYSNPKILLNNRTSPNVSSHQNISSQEKLAETSPPGELKPFDASELGQIEEDIFRNDHMKTKVHEARKVPRKKEMKHSTQDESNKVMKIATQTRFRTDKLKKLVNQIKTARTENL